MLKQKSMLIVYATVLCLMIVSFSWAEGQKEAIIEAGFGNIYPVEHFYSKADMRLVDLIDKKSDGSIKFTYYPASQLGSEREQVEAVKLGSLGMTNTTPGLLASFYPRFAMLEMPYLCLNWEEYHKITESEWLLELTEELRNKTGIRILGWLDRAPRHLTTNFPVESPDDIKGLKIRVSEVPIRVALWKALGTNPTPISFGELYMALATGVVDAQENPLDTIVGAKLYEQQKYVALTAHMHEFICYIANDKWFNGLSSKQQEAITEAFSEHIPYVRKIVRSAEEESLKILKDKGIIITEPDRKLFMEKTKDVYKQFLGDFTEEDWQKLQSELGRVGKTQ